MTTGEWRSTFGPQGAVFSSDGSRRLLLWRTLGALDGRLDKPLLGVQMKNPSKAGADVDDATVRVLMRIAYDDGAGGFLVGNLVPIIATDPREMMRVVKARTESAASMAEWGRGMEENEAEVERIRSHCPRVLVAWGKLDGVLRDLAATALLKLSKPYWHGEMVTLGRNKDGTPHHPLRTKLQPLQPFYARGGVAEIGAKETT